MKLKNILLTLSLVSFAVGFSDFQESIFFWSGRPFGALLFGFYMILVVLEKETALFDEQERAKNPAATAKPAGSSNEPASRYILEPATSR